MWITFNFNKDNTFNSASIDIDASKLVAYLNKQAETEAEGDESAASKGKVTVNIDKLVLSNDVTVKVFEGTPLDGKVGNDTDKVTNILDFAAVINAEGADDKYKMTVDFDANPFAFVDMMKYSAKQDTHEPDGVIDDKDEDTIVGQKFWEKKLVECLKKLGTAKIIVTKSNYGKSTFDAAKAAVRAMSSSTPNSILPTKPRRSISSSGTRLRTSPPPSATSPSR